MIRTIGAPCVALALLLSCAAVPEYDRQAVTQLDPTGWITLSTDQFRILTDGSAKQLRDLANDLETFASITRRVTGAEIRGVRPRIYAFASRKHFDFVAQGRDVDGVAIDVLDGTFAYLPLMAGRGPLREVLYHEFVHLLLYDSDFRYPLWFHEGIAQLLSSMDVRDDAVSLGLPLPHVIEQLGRGTWIPLGELLSATSTHGMDVDFARQFYGEAWAFVHYLQANHAAEMRILLDELNGGRPWREALPSVLGRSAMELDTDLRAYVKSLRQRVDFLSMSAPERTATQPRAIRRVSETRAGFALAQLLLAQGGLLLPEAEALLRRALSRNPGDVRAAAALAWCEAMTDSGETQTEVVIADPGSDPWALLYRGRADLVRASRLSREEREPRLTLARDWFRRSAYAAPHFAAPLAELGLSYFGDAVAAGGINEGIGALERADALRPGLSEVQYGLGILHERAGDATAARRHLERTVVLAHGSGLAAAAQQALDRLRER